MTAQNKYHSSPFGNLSDGRPAHLITLKNQSGAIAKITNYGAALVELWMPDRNGKFANVILGYDNLNDYESHTACFGATIGRFANRIANGKFSLNQQEYQLSINTPPHHLHGGHKGWNQQIWEFKDLKMESGAGVELTYFSKDGEEGYPGNLEIAVRYILTEQNQLAIEYEAVSDQDTIINPTNHAYFNLNGAENILEHELEINSEKITINNATHVPNGCFLKVENTPFDFQESTPIGQQLSTPHRFLKDGFDHNFAINDYDGFIKPAATLYEPTSGRCLTVLTAMPGLQLYTGNGLNETKKSENTFFEKYAGVCLETQFFPDSPNKIHFQSPILESEDGFQTATIYAFSVR